MLPKHARLSRKGFAELGRTRRAQSEHFSLVFTTTATRSGAAVVVSKKVAASAVARHLLKRRIRAILVPHLIPHLALVVHVRPGAGTLAFAALQSELSSLVASVVR